MRDTPILSHTLREDITRGYAAKVSTAGLWPTLSAHYDIGERVQLLLEMEHPLFVIGEGLRVFLDALASTFLEVRLHKHSVLEVFELLPDAFQRPVYPRIAAERNVPVCFRHAQRSV